MLPLWMCARRYLLVNNNLIVNKVASKGVSANTVCVCVYVCVVGKVLPSDM